VSGNTAQHNGGGIAMISGTLTLTNSTVSGNTAEEIGGGILCTSGTIALTNSTVSGNRASAGGGIVAAGAPKGPGPAPRLTLTDSTVSGNTADRGGGIACEIADCTIVGSLVDGDCVGGDFGDITSNGYNIESPGDTCGLDPEGTDQVNVTAEQLNLRPLQDNGGPTMTHALGAGSVAIDWIPAVDCVDADGEPLTIDQRGEPRPETGGTMCDIGAFELQP
jgi:predicted outer membrane repeat protein